MESDATRRKTAKRDINGRQWRRWNEMKMWGLETDASRAPDTSVRVFFIYFNYSTNIIYSLNYVMTMDDDGLRWQMTTMKMDNNDDRRRRGNDGREYIDNDGDGSTMIRKQQQQKGGLETDVSRAPDTGFFIPFSLLYFFTNTID